MPALPVGRDRFDLGRADAEVAERPVDRDVPLLAREHPDARRALKAVAEDVPACPREHVMPGRRECGHVRHLAAGDVGGRDVLRQAEQLAQPIE